MVVKIQKIETRMTMALYLQILPKSLPLALESIGHHWPEDHVERPQGYPYYHWLQTETGVGVVAIEQRTFLLKPGQGVLIRPFVAHQYWAQQPWQTRFATFNGRLEPNINQIVGEAPFIRSEDQKFFSFSEWIDQTIAAYLNHSLDQQSASVTVYQFLLALSQHYPRADVKNDQPRYREFVLPTIKKIETDFAQPLTVEILAQARFITPQYLTRLFKRYTGVTTQEYLLETRLNQAKELLIGQPQLSIAAIAHAVGIAAPSNFIKQFKTANKVTPAKFRKFYQ